VNETRTIRRRGGASFGGELSQTARMTKPCAIAKDLTVGHFVGEGAGFGGCEIEFESGCKGLDHGIIARLEELDPL